MPKYKVTRKSDGKVLRFTHGSPLKMGESVFVLPRSYGGYVVWAKDAENRDVVVEVLCGFQESAPKRRK